MRLNDLLKNCLRQKANVTVFARNVSIIFLEYILKSRKVYCAWYCLRMQQGKVLIEWDQNLNERKKKLVLYFQDSYDPFIKLL